MKISVVIPTYRRARDLELCVDSVLAQARLPGEIIVVDDGEMEAGALREKVLAAGVAFLYHRKAVPDVCESRNIGAAMASGDVIFFFDDDVVVRPGYIEEVEGIFEADREGRVGGVGGVVENIPGPLGRKERLRQHLLALFLAGGAREGRLLPSGFSIDFGYGLTPFLEASKVDFLYGGVSAYRREVFERFRYEKGFWNYSFGEDKDFSCSVATEFLLMCSPRAKVFHSESRIMRPDERRIGKLTIKAIYILFRRYRYERWYSGVLFLYAAAGFLLVEALAASLPPRRSKWERIVGYLQGFGDIFAGRNFPSLRRVRSRTAGGGAPGEGGPA